MKQVKKDDHCQGIHVQINWVNKMLVDELHKNDKIVAVWVDSSVDIYQENDDFYRKIYDLGVDMLTTDYPHRA
jgi:glycerophosphoryl diester phosphodiesterase